MTPPAILTRNREFYRANARRFARCGTANRALALHRLFMAALPRGAKILDAGCGGGADAALFARHGFSVSAFDASPEMVRLCRRRGVKARRLTLQRLESDGVFDGVWAAACMQHVPRVQISDVLRRLVRALKADGLLFVSIWRGSGEGIQPDGRFVSRYSAKEIRGHLAATGEMRVVKMWHSRSPEEPAVRWLSVLARRVGCGERKAARPGSRRTHDGRE